MSRPTQPSNGMAGIAGAIVLSMSLAVPGLAPGAADDLRQDASRALRLAAEHFRTRVAVQGGYLWRYSDDLSRREGEGKATAAMAWVQPPGTPAVGMAFLRAHEATDDSFYLEAAREAGEALARGQLRSGGWDYTIHFDSRERKAYAYRLDGGEEGARNWTTLDDDTTQSAVRFLIRLDGALGRKEARIHDAVAYALECLLKAQYPNGAWPQRYERFPDPARFPVKRASYPESWARIHPGADYRGHYTLNDGLILDMIDTLLEAARAYGDERHDRSARRAGEFLLLAQMPEPQPAWAQQYDTDMHPAWARKFEPPAITGGESRGALRALLRLYRETGDGRFLEPVPRALAYLERSRLPDGRLARFYELGTNRPLYFTRSYELTYEDSDLPTHYAFQVKDDTQGLREEYDRVRALSPGELRRPRDPPRPGVNTGLERRVKEVIAALDARGAWVEEGRLRYAEPEGPPRRVIDSGIFIRNLNLLCDYLLATR